MRTSLAIVGRGGWRLVEVWVGDGWGVEALALLRLGERCLGRVAWALLVRALDGRGARRRGGLRRARFSRELRGSDCWALGARARSL